MNRVNLWLQRLGVAGVLGLGTFLACIAFYFSAVAPAARELARQQIISERIHSRQPYQPVGTAGRVEELQRFHSLFPRVEHLSDELERLYGLARNANLELSRGEYRLETPRVGLWAYHVVLPVRGTYPQVRGFVSAVLKSMPVVSVDGLRFERKKVGESILNAQLRLTLYFQPRE